MRNEESEEGTSVKCRVTSGSRERKSHEEKITVLILCAMLLALSFPAWAQEPKKIPRIGFLGASSPSAISARLDAFRQGLRELGYVEGKTLSLSIDMRREN